MRLPTIDKGDDAAAAEQGDAEPLTTWLARDLPTAARILLLFVFLVFGLDGVLRFLAPPTAPIPDGAPAFGSARGDR